MKSERKALQLRDAAAEKTLREVSRLASEAQPKIAAMLVYIRAHLFDRNLSVHQVRKACSLRDNSVALQFHNALGVPPARFIANCRLAVAERLLAESWLPVWQISELLGFSSIQVFSRSFFRVKKVRPRDFRQRTRMNVGPTEEGGKPVPAPEPDFLERALAGEADSAEVAELIGMLLKIYPPRQRAAGSTTPP